MAISTQSTTSSVLTPNQTAAPITADNFIRAETDRTFAGFSAATETSRSSTGSGNCQTSKP
jgi:hypothetical protein